MAPNRRTMRDPRSVLLVALAILLVNCGGGYDEPAGPAAAATADETACCNCTVSSAVPLADSDPLPCTFDHPTGWKAVVGSDGALVSAVVGPINCGGNCPMGEPGIAFSIATKPDSNADTMEEIWRQALPIVGDARCGDATVTFFSPPGADPNGLLGGVKFYIGHRGKKYSGAATFTCGTPGEWQELRKLFIDTFRTNAGTTFGG